MAQGAEGFLIYRKYSSMEPQSDVSWKAKYFAGMLIKYHAEQVPQKEEKT